MQRNGWLHGAFAIVMAMTVAIAAVSWSPLGSPWAAIGIVLALSAAYVAFGRFGYDVRWAGFAFVAVMVLATFGLVAVCPSTAYVQVIVYPVLWLQLDRLRDAVVATVLVGVAASAGFLVSLGATWATWSQVLVTEGISIAGSIALGLWITRIATLSAERQRLLDELHAAQDSLADANRQAGAASERERLARELHDTIAQDLAGIVMLAQRTRRTLSSGDAVTAAERLGVLEDSARSALEESRALVAAGAAGVPGDSLAGALHRLGERFTRETGVPVSVSASSDVAIDRDAQVVLLRVAQEALANVRAHASAGAVSIALTESGSESRPESEPGAEPGCAGGSTLTVRDDGRGFDVTSPSPGYGLPGLRDRLALAGGTFTVTSTPGSGTTVSAAVPALAVPAVPTPLERRAVTDGRDPAAVPTEHDRSADVSGGADGSTSLQAGAAHATGATGVTR